jgi:hypothetical protein
LSHYTGPKKRAEDHSTPWRWSEFFHKWSFIWWTLLLLGVSYPAKVVTGLRSETKQTVQQSETRLQVQIDTLKMKVTNTERNQDGMLEIMEALLRIRCTELSDREIRRLGVPCKMADK